MNKVKMTVCIEKKEYTKFLRILDLFDDKKVLVETVDIRFETTTEINHDYFMNFIEKSKNLENRIVAIFHDGNIYHDPDVLVISDGKNECFLTKEPLDNTMGLA